MKGKKMIYGGLPVLGILFCFLYLNRAVVDVAYTDYIRLINSYLPDVWNPDKFFVADVLTRIPLNYVERILNVTFFGYNTVVEMGLGVLGLGASAWVLAGYCRKHQVSYIWYGMIMLLLFSLNKWEMLTNGTGWVHFTAFACFYYHYTVLDRVYRGETKRGDTVRMCVLPFVITLGVAGPYCAVYSAVMVLSCICVAGLRVFRAGSLKKSSAEVKKWMLFAVCVLIPLFLYIWSNSCTVEEHAGAVDIPLKTALFDNPGFFLVFFVKSFASTVLGDECIRNVLAQDWQILLLGGFVIGCYLLALYLNWKNRIYERTILPLVFLAAGGMNHVLILLSRWIFMKSDYGMSSRYALQFQVGIIGIFLTFAFSGRSRMTVFPSKRNEKRNAQKGNVPKENAPKESVRKENARKENAQKRSRMQRKSGWSFVYLVLALVFVAGSVYTTCCEWKKAPYRKENLIEKREAALHYEELTDEELERIFQYKKGPDQIRRAFAILEENKWNVFRE